jgi:hypothetical protein
MSAGHREPGTTMDERSGKVVERLSSMDRHRIPDIIKELKSRVK